MRERWRKLSLERRNFLAIAVTVLFAVTVFFGWKAWQRVNAVFVPVWKRSVDESVFKIAFSPNGQFLGVLSWQGQKATISLLRVADGKTVRTFSNVGRAEVFDFSPDGQKLVVGSLIPKGQQPGEVLLLRVADGQIMWRKRSHRIVSIAFSPGGRIVVSADTDGTICLWRATDGKLLKTIRVSRQLAHPKIFSLSPNSRLLAVGGDSLTVWHLDEGKMLRRLKFANSEIISPVDFSPDGQYIVSGRLSDKPGEALTLWRVSDWAEIQKCQGHYRFGFLQGVTDLAFSPDSHWLISTGFDGKLKLWSIPDGKLVGEKSFGWVVDREVFKFFHAINWRHVNWRLVRWAFFQLVRPKCAFNVTFSPDGKHIAVAWEPNKVGLFRVRLPRK